MNIMQKLPYLPKNKEILYVPVNNKFMQKAKLAAKTLSLDPAHATGAVIVKNEKIIGTGANGSSFHKFPGCIRKLLKAKTGTLYWTCPGCSPKNHAEASAIDNALKKNKKTDNTDLYLWGHWWCCEPCWNRMIKAGIKNVYLPDSAVKLFKK